MIYFAQKAFILENNQLLMVRKSSADPVQPDKWEVPGGRMEEGEDLDGHLKREVFEETGFIVVPNRAFYVWQWRIPARIQAGTMDTVIAVARTCTRIGGLESNQHQVTEDFLAEIRWVPLANVISMDVIQNMLPVFAEFMRLHNTHAIS